MGQDSSRLIDESVPPDTLRSRTIQSLADYLKSEKCRRVVVMTGAGISTSCGIPDFRSPKTGIYANLARLNLPHPEAVFDIEFFRENPVPFYTLAHELYPGKFYPSISHSFVSLLHRKGLLLKLFTQNIDCLERAAGVPNEMVVEAHGSFASQRCIDCASEYPDDKMLEAIMNKTVPRCINQSCDGFVKPDIVFFGESLPLSFFEHRMLLCDADLVIIMGTSLSVQPFASLPDMAVERKPRLLVNLERVGTLGARADDVLVLKNCDDGIKELATACGWLQELETLWRSTRPSSEPGTAEQSMPAPNVTLTPDELLAEEVARITSEIEQSLKLTEEHKRETEAALGIANGKKNMEAQPSSQVSEQEHSNAQTATNIELPKPPTITQAAAYPRLEHSDDARAKSEERRQSQTTSSENDTILKMSK